MALGTVGLCVCGCVQRAGNVVTWHMALWRTPRPTVCHGSGRRQGRTVIVARASRTGRFYRADGAAPQKTRSRGYQRKNGTVRRAAEEHHRRPLQYKYANFQKTGTEHTVGCFFSGQTSPTCTHAHSHPAVFCSVQSQTHTLAICVLTSYLEHACAQIARRENANEPTHTHARVRAAE